MADEKHPPRKFKFEIHSYDDVEEHLDRLWEISNMLCEQTKQPCGCTDPPSCCSTHPHKDEGD